MLVQLSSREFTNMHVRVCVCECTCVCVCVRLDYLDESIRLNSELLIQSYSSAKRLLVYVNKNYSVKPINAN